MLDIAQDDMNDRAVIGGNNPPAPTPLDTWKLCADTLHEAAEGFTEITNDEQAASVEATIEEVKAAIKGADEAVKAGRKPHNDAATAVTTSFKPVRDKLATANTVVVALMGAWRTKKIEAKRIEDAKAKKIADEKAEELRKAEAAVDKTETASIERVAELKVEAKVAKQDSKAARSAKVSSGGIRMVTKREGTITGLNANLRHILETDKAALEVFAKEWNAKAIRGGARDIPGVAIREWQEPQ